MTEELSSDEERRIGNLSVIPTAIVVYVFIGYLVYLIHIGFSFQSSFFLLYFLLTFMLAGIAYFLAFNILYARKTKQPFASRIKSFLGMVLLLIGAFATLGALYLVVNFALSPMIGYNELVILVATGWFVIWGLLVFYFREKFNQLSKGQW